MTASAVPLQVLFVMCFLLPFARRAVVRRDREYASPGQGYAGSGQEWVHCWLPPPLQVQISTAVPLAVAAPVTSRQRPDSTPTIVPSAFHCHFWLAPPLQVQIWT